MDLSALAGPEPGCAVSGIIEAKAAMSARRRLGCSSECRRLATGLRLACEDTQTAVHLLNLLDQFRAHRQQGPYGI